MPDGRGGRRWQRAGGPDGSCWGGGAGGPDGRGGGARSARWPGGRDGRVHEGQMAVAGGSGPDGQMGMGYCEQDGGGRALGWDTRQGMGWDCRHLVWFQTGMEFQSCGGIPDTGGVPDRDGGYQTGGGIPGVGGGIPDAGDGIPDAGGVPDMGRWGTRQGMMGCQAGVE